MMPPLALRKNFLAFALLMNEIFGQSILSKLLPPDVRLFTKFNFDWSSAPDPAITPLDPLAGFEVAYFKVEVMEWNVEGKRMGRGSPFLKS